MVLTTHSLEEADVLGDQVAIMASGALQTIGPSLLLKRKYGAGYRITVTFSSPYEDPLPAAGLSGRQQQPVARHGFADRLKGRKALVKQAVLERVMVLMTMEDAGETLQFRVERGSDDKLCAVLEKLEARREEWGLSSIDVSLPSLEEVFLEVTSRAAAAAGGVSAAAPVGSDP